MKNILFCITLLGLLSIGSTASAATISPDENTFSNPPATTTTVNIVLDFGSTTCAAWCCYAWEIRTYEKNSGGTTHLIDTHYFNCSTSYYPITVTVDNGYSYIQTVVIATGTSVCIPAPPYQNWASGWYNISGGDPPPWYPVICA
jgi:hypothetical protein